MDYKTNRNRVRELLDELKDSIEKSEEDINKVRSNVDEMLSTVYLGMNKRLNIMSALEQEWLKQGKENGKEEGK